MTCLGIDRIYLYLEGELPDSERSRVEAHLADCPACRNAVEDRRLLLEASAEIPPLPIPENFSQSVMRRIFQERIPMRDVLIATSIGLSAMLTTMLTVFIWSGQSLIDFLVGINHTALSSLQSFFINCAKLFKLVLLLAKVLRQMGGFLAEGLARLTSLLSPEFQVGMIGVVMLASAVIFHFLRKKHLIGDRI